MCYRERNLCNKLIFINLKKPYRSLIQKVSELFVGHEYRSKLSREIEHPKMKSVDVYRS